MSPREVAGVLGVSHQTIRRWVANGECPNALAHLSGNRIGIPSMWVDRIISQPLVVDGMGDGGAAPLTASAEGGTPTLRTVRGSYPRTA